MVLEVPAKTIQYPRPLTPRACLLLVLLATSALAAGCNLHFDVDSVPRPDASTMDTWLDEGFEPFDDCDALGLTQCQNRCRDLVNDPYFCGNCTTRCLPTETCDAGRCIPAACPFDPGSIPGACDPVRAQGCDSHQACILTFIPSTARFGAICENRTNLASDAAIGSTCTSVTDCSEGQSCVLWDAPDPRSRVCSKICHLDSSLGCDDDEFCVNPHPKQTNDQGDPVDILTGLGYCTRRCSPTNHNTCPPGQACVPDEGFGAYACHANFRCLENAGTTGKGLLSTCNRNDLHRDGCPSGLLCMPQPAGDRCMRPCVADTECSQGTCQPAPTPWDFLSLCTP